MTKKEAPPPNELYRENVSLITRRGSRFLLVNLTVWPPDYWKFPQGGVNPGESLEAAARREFQEELGTESMRITARSGVTRRYRWEAPVNIHGEVYVGQEQTFFLIEFLGEEKDIVLGKNEIRAYCLCYNDELQRLIARSELDIADYWETIHTVLQTHGFNK